MNDKLLKSWGKGQLKIHDVELGCYVLEDGTPAFDKSKIFKALDRPIKGSSSDKPAFISASNLQPFVRKELEEKLEGMEFMDGRKKVSGYHADILPLICNVYLEAREAKVLTPSQLPVAQQCEILIRSFAKVGVTALIYEQVGFEKYKHPDALRLLIESYLSDEVRKWSKEFPDELFFQMDRIYGNYKTTSRNRPLYYAKFLRKYIYDPIEQGLVLNRLDEKNPKNQKGIRKNRHHSHLNERVGLPALKSQIWQVIGVLKISPNKRKFETNYQRLTGQSVQTDLFDN